MGRSRALELIDAVSELSVCFVGDAIIDEYRYCQPLNKSPKENLIPVRWHSTDEFHGGVEAAANHARTFCRAVDIMSKGLATRKVRFLEQPYNRKVFEYQCVAESVSLDPGSLLGYDMVVVTDFGHGELMKHARQHLCEWVPKLAVNTQTNAANYGFNPITNYRRADYIVIDEPEARLSAHDRDSPIEEVIERLADGRCKKFIVTRGTEGAIGYDGKRFVKQRAFTKTVVDTMGAGDAFFAVTAPMSQVGELEELLLIGNAAGALKCGILGHREPVTKQHVVEFLRSHV